MEQLPTHPRQKSMRTVCASHMALNICLKRRKVVRHRLLKTSASGLLLGRCQHVWVPPNTALLLLFNQTKAFHTVLNDHNSRPQAGIGAGLRCWPRLMPFGKVCHAASSFLSTLQGLCRGQGAGGLAAVLWEQKLQKAALLSSQCPSLLSVSSAPKLHEDQAPRA